MGLFHNPGPPPKLHTLPRMPFPTLTAWQSPHSTFKAKLVSPPQHAFLTALLPPWCDWSALQSTHGWLPSAYPNEKGENLLWNQAHLTPKPFVFSGISVTRQFAAKSELSNMVAMSHMWLLRVETQLVQIKITVKIGTTLNLENSMNVRI